jgi:hypothetical protein
MPDTPEQRTRIHIDAKLSAAGWHIKDKKELNLSAARGDAVHEARSMDGHTDYILLLNRLKPKTRQGQGFLVKACQDFEKVGLKNLIPDTNSA